MEVVEHKGHFLEMCDVVGAGGDGVEAVGVGGDVVGGPGFAGLAAVGDEDFVAEVGG